MGRREVLQRRLDQRSDRSHGGELENALCLFALLLNGFQTHNITLTQSIAGFVVSIKDGRIISQGTTSNALSMLASAQVKTEEFLIEDVEIPETQPRDDAAEKQNKEGQGKIIVAEEVEVGNVSWPARKSSFSVFNG